MGKIKVIFLDVDGVLNSDRTARRTQSGYTFVDNRQMKNLKHIINMTGAKVVLSSDWRYDRDDPRYNGDYHTCKTKVERLLELFPFLDWEHIIFACNKQMVRGDVLIDDAPHNLVGGEYAKILFDRPHNRSFDHVAHDALRVNTWEEIDQVIHSYLL